MDFSTTVDASSENGNNDDVFLPDRPLTLLQNGEINSMPVIFGVNSGERLFTSLGSNPCRTIHNKFIIVGWIDTKFYQTFLLTAILNSPNLTEEISENWAEITVGENYLNLQNCAVEPEVIANAARDFYLGEKNISRENVGNLTNIFSGT